GRRSGSERGDSRRLHRQPPAAPLALAHGEAVAYPFPAVGGRGLSERVDIGGFLSTSTRQSGTGQGDYRRTRSLTLCRENEADVAGLVSQRRTGNARQYRALSHVRSAAHV